MAYLPVPNSSFATALVPVPASQLDANFLYVSGKVVSVKDYGAIGNGVTDDTVAIRAAGAAIVASGGGTLWFEAGKSYKVWTAGVSTIIALNGANNVVIHGNGCSIVSALVNPSAGDAVFIDNNGVNGLWVDGFTFTGGNTTLTANTGERFMYGHDGSMNMFLTNCTINNCVSGPYYAPSSPPSQNRGVVVRNVTFNKVYYPMPMYQTDDIEANYTALNCGRAVVIAAPANNINISVDSQHGGPFTDCIMSVNALSTNTVAQNTLSNIRVNYRTLGRFAGSGNQNTAEGLMVLQLNQADSNSAAGHIRNVKINFAADASASAKPANIFMFRRYGTGTSGDPIVRGHSIQDVTISGSAINWNNSLENGLALFYTADGANWTGDTINNIAVRDVQIAGLPPAGDSIYVNGQGFSNSTQSLEIDNVVVDGTYTEANVTAGRIAKRAFVASNYSGADCDGSWVPSLGGTTTYTTQLGTWRKEGRKVTIQGQIVVNVIGTGSTGTVTGLPFTPSGTQAANVGFFANSVTNYSFVGAFVTGTPALVINGIAAAGASMTTPAVFFGNSTNVVFSATYFI